MAGDVADDTRAERTRTRRKTTEGLEGGFQSFGEVTRRGGILRWTVWATSGKGGDPVSVAVLVKMTINPSKQSFQ